MPKPRSGTEGAAANGFIYLTNSGAAALDGSMASDVDGHPGIKPAWEMTETDISRCLDATRWGAGKLATFRGGGFSSSFLSKGGVPLTMIRLNLLKGLGACVAVCRRRERRTSG